jgi:hypothetical protein
MFYTSAITGDLTKLTKVTREGDIEDIGRCKPIACMTTRAISGVSDQIGGVQSTLRLMLHAGKLKSAFLVS